MSRNRLDQLKRYADNHAKRLKKHRLACGKCRRAEACKVAESITDEAFQADERFQLEKTANG